eukprot:COSAG02_NODE_2111_length_9804_cov_5.586296_7_plen_491_part_00
MQDRQGGAQGVRGFLAGAQTCSGGSKCGKSESSWRSRQLYGHSGRHFNAAFAPPQAGAVNQLLATASEDQTARVWDAASGRCLRCLHSAHEDEVLRVAWSGDGSMLATGGADGKAKLWRAANDWPCIATLDHGKEKQIYALLYTSNGMQHGEQLLTACDDSIARWDLGAPTKVAQVWSFPNMEFGPGHGGKARNPDATVDVFDVAIPEAGTVEQGPGTSGGENGNIQKGEGVAVNGGHHLLAAALGDGSVRVVDSRSPSVVAVLLHLHAGKQGGAGLPAATGVAFGPSGNELVRPRYRFRVDSLRWRFSLHSGIPQVSCDTAGFARVWDCRAWGPARHTVTPSADSEDANPLFGCTFWPATAQSSFSSGGGEFLVWSSTGLLSGFGVSDGCLLGSWMCGDALPRNEAEQKMQQYPVFDLAIADSGLYVCAVGGRSERQRQRVAATGSAEQQNGWGVPAQLWCTAVGTDDTVRPNMHCLPKHCACCTRTIV